MDIRSTEATDRKDAMANKDRVRSRRRRTTCDGALRFFLPKQGSSPRTPELGQEMGTEGEALLEAFRSGQPFYTLAAWKAVPEVNGGNPVIVKQAVVEKTP